MTKALRGSLKAQYGKQLGAILAANLALFVVVARAVPVLDLGLRGLWGSGEGVAWMAAAGVLTTVLNGLVSAPLKARIVFLRWREALPGHRAFSVLGPRDARIEMSKVESLLGGLPQDASAENKAWYGLFKAQEADAAVTEAHKSFLYTRDYTALALLALIMLGPACLILSRGSVPSWVYVGGLVLQVLLVRHAAATYGERFVCTVLACATTAPAATPKRPGRKKKY